MKKRSKPSSPRAGQPGRRVNRSAGAAAAAVVAAALSAAASGNAIAAADARAGASDLADRVLALRQSLAEKAPSAEGKAPWIDQTLTPGSKLSQWKKWNNG